MYWYSFLIILTFLAAKGIQLLGSFALAHMLVGKEGSTILINILIFMVVATIARYVLKVYLPKVYRFFGLALLPLLLIIALLDYELVMILLSGFFLFLLVMSEVKVMKSLKKIKIIPEWVYVLLAVLPVFISYQLPQINDATPFLYYVVSSLFVFIISRYSEEGAHHSDEGPGIFMGLFFLAASGMIYYLLSAFRSDPDSALYTLTFVLLFYTGGTAFIYMKLDTYVRKLNSKLRSVV